MDKNTVTGLILIGIILLVYSMYNTNRMAEEQERQQQVQTDSIIKNNPPKTTYLDSMPESKVSESDRKAIEPATTDTSQTKKIKQQDIGPFFHAQDGSEKSYTLENEFLKVTLTNKGGSVSSVEMKQYNTSDSLPLILFKGEERIKNFQFFIRNNRVVNTKDLFFEVQQSKETPSISFLLSADQGQYFKQTYTLVKDKKYLLDYNIELVGFDKVIPQSANYLNLYWKRDVRQLEKGKDGENRYTELHYKYTDDEVGNLSETSNDEASLSTSVSWVSMKQQFFNSTLMFEDGFSSGTVKSRMSEEEAYLKTMEASMILPFNNSSSQSYSMKYYFGPNHYQTLKSFHNDLEDIVMVTGFMSWVSVINKWIIIPIFNFLNNYISNYGIIILILTLIIKLVLSPFTYKSYKSAAMMKMLKPELDELKEKFKDDQQKFGTEQWKLYQKAGVSPLGGCLPMLLQMPILIAMYYFFPTSIELRQESFLWATDLSTYDSILDLPFTIPFYGDHVSLFTLLMAGSQVLYTLTQPQMATGPASMKYMPYIMPVMFLGIFNSFPAALTYYYFLANIISYIQQFVIKKFIIDEDALHKKIQENKKKPVKKSGFQKRLEELAKQQKQAQSKRKR